MSPFMIHLLPIVAGLLLLTLGFSLRERNSGVLMMWIGTIAVFATACWKILEKLA